MADDRVALSIHGVAVGGDGVGRDGDGRIVFVPGAMVGETVNVEIVRAKKRHARGRLIDVVERSGQRVEPTCNVHHAGCGGCGWLHMSAEAQHAAKESMVRQALQFVGRLPETVVDEFALSWASPLTGTGFRTQVRCGVIDGRAAFRRGASNDLVRAPSCEVAHPAIVEVMESGRFPNSTEVEIRHGAQTGDLLLVTDTGASSVVLPAELAARTQVVDKGQAIAPSVNTETPPVHYIEVIAGRRLRVSADSFFQTRSDGAEVLVSEVREALGTAAVGTLLDVGCGVGLFASTIEADRVIGVERARSSAADAVHNLSDRNATVVRSAIEHWQPEPVDAVIADPSRAGLGADAVSTIARAEPERIVLVSCDVGSFGRDTGLLVEHGWNPLAIRLIDMFPHTPHVEVVTSFERAEQQ